MPRNPSLSCRACGQPMWKSNSSLPQGQAMCRPCRRLNPQRATHGDCERCGKPRTTGKRFCSNRCANHTTLGVVVGSERPVRRPCEVCGTEYRAKMSGQRSCSRACGVVLRRAITGTLNPPRVKPEPRARATRVAYRECVACDRLFVTSAKRNARCCSEDCKRHAQAHRRVERIIPGGCIGCGSDLTTTNGGRPPSYCAECKREKHRADRRLRTSTFGKTYRSRARAYGVEYEQVNRRTVFERDRWKCGLCGKTVDRTKKAPHPRSPTIDHVVPMSCGGPHTYANVQLACFLCNSIKGNRGSQQLALVG